MKPEFYPRALLISRISVGLTFLISGIGKIIDSSGALQLIELISYEIYWLIEYRYEIIALITITELLLAFSLLLGKSLYPAFVISLLFIAGLSSTIVFLWIRGYVIESCGCFGIFDFLNGPVATLAKNIVLLAVLIVGLVSLSKTKSGSFFNLIPGYNHES